MPPRVFVSLGAERASLVSRLVELGRDRGWRMLDQRFYVEPLAWEHPPQGAFLEYLPGHPCVRYLQEIGSHILRMGHFPHPHDHELPVVLSDLPAAGRMAAEHYAERRFRHVGYIAYNSWGELSQLLYEPFRLRASELGCAVKLLVFRDITRKEMQLTQDERTALRQADFAEWLRQVPKPIGLFTFSDVHAGRLCATILEAGYKIPEQVAMLGYGGDRATCVSAPALLSTVDAAEDAVAGTAMALMQSFLDGAPYPTERVLVPPRGIVVRESTDVLASADPAVARAIRFMWDRLSEDLSVDDVAVAVDTPRRKLERAFLRDIGHGINAEFRRRRLESCCELLRTTELSVTDIAPRIGFPNKNYLHATFRKYYGMTPQAYRQQHSSL